MGTESQAVSEPTTAIATGGQAELIVRGSRYLKETDADLTLRGLHLIWERNHKR